MSAATASSPFGPKEICKCLDYKQQIIKSGIKSINVASTTKKQPGNLKGSQPHEKETCGNCGRCHPMKQCWQPSEAMEGCSSEVIASWSASQGKKGTMSTMFTMKGNPSDVKYSASGRVYILDSAGSAVFLANDAATSDIKPLNAQSVDFAGISADVSP